MNLNRDNKIKKSDGSEQIVVVYPKFKNGEATIKGVKVEANFCKLLPMHIIHFINSIQMCNGPARSLYYSSYISRLFA